MAMRQYPFHADAAGACTIYDPLTKVAITTLPFLGKSRKQLLMGISLASDANVFKNNVRVKIGNSLADYRYLECSPNGHNNCSLTLGHVETLNYRDLGGQPIQEGDTLTITAQVGTFTTGVLHVDDLEGTDPPIPQGNLICLHMNGLADLGATLASTTIDTRKLSNNRKYSLFKSELLPEGSAAVSIEIIMMQCGNKTVCIPMDTMVWDRVPFSFSGLEWNQGQVLCYGQAEAAEKFDLRLWLIETDIQGAEKSDNESPVNALIPSGPVHLQIPVSGSRKFNYTDTSRDLKAKKSNSYSLLR